MERVTTCVSVLFPRDLLRRLDRARRRQTQEAGGHVPRATLVRRAVALHLIDLEEQGGATRHPGKPRQGKRAQSKRFAEKAIS
jgi:hypothetical protein